MIAEFNDRKIVLGLQYARWSPACIYLLTWTCLLSCFAYSSVSTFSNPGSRLGNDHQFPFQEEKRFHLFLGWEEVTFVWHISWGSTSFPAKYKTVCISVWISAYKYIYIYMWIPAYKIYIYILTSSFTDIHSFSPAFNFSAVSAPLLVHVSLHRMTKGSAFFSNKPSMLSVHWHWVHPCPLLIP